MTKYVIGPDVALRLAHDEAVIPDEHQLLAPTLLRSQMLVLLYRAVRHGEMTKRTPIVGSTTCGRSGFGCSETVSFRTSLGRSPTSSDGKTRSTPSTPH
jgi:hypothetical protein